MTKILIAVQVLFPTLLLCSGCLATDPPYNFSNTLIGYWTADGNANDSLGMNHGYLRNGIVFSKGVSNAAFRFDGVDDFVEIPSNPSLSPHGDFTIIALVRPETLVPMPVLSKYDFSGGRFSDCSYHLSLNAAGTVQFGVTFGHADMAIYTSNPAIKAGRFNHLAAVFHAGQTSAMEVYVNGKLQPGSIKGNLAGINQNDIPVRIGQRIDGSGPAYFQGQIDEIIIYGRALSSTEIKRMYKRPNRPI